jgi:UDP-N-acetylmuramoylalanine--D-glutamate ligase
MMEACGAEQGAIDMNQRPGRAAAKLRARLGIEGRTLVVGLGMTGFSCARFLDRLGLEVAITDSRAEPPHLAAARRELPNVPLFLDGFSLDAIDHCDQVVVSPGLSLRHPCLDRARRLGRPLIGDIELFARCADAPVIAITGSNGKSTVTALVGEMARCAGREVRVGGNIGTPVLNLLSDGPPELYVLELSSFQLETTSSLDARAATVLNVSPDHLDRYRDLAEYRDAKLRIFGGDGVRVVNRDDPELSAALPGGGERLSFGSGAPANSAEFGLVVRDGATWLARGGERLMPASDMRIRGRHNALNALAALALGSAAGLPDDAMQDALRNFPGLPHRTQWLGEHRGAAWYNDSKGTNVGATIAAVEGLDGKVVLIAGGVGKGQDFTPLRAALAGRARAVLLFGADAGRIEQALAGALAPERLPDLQAAVDRAVQIAEPGDSVLLSPACASFDMFDNYEARGRFFIDAFRRLAS